MKKRRWIDTLVIFLIMIIACVVRVVYTNLYLNEINVSEELLQQAWTAGKNPFLSFNLSLDGVYTLCLSLAMLFFGNKAIVGVSVNILLQIVNLLIIYLCIRIVSDVVAAAVPTLIIACLPICFTTVGNISSFHIFNIFMTGCILLVVIVLKLLACGIRKLTHKNRDEDFILEDTFYSSQGEISNLGNAKVVVNQENISEVEEIDYSLENDEEFDDDEIDNQEDLLQEQPYQDEIWNQNGKTQIKPFSESELDALADQTEKKLQPVKKVNAEPVKRKEVLDQGDNNMKIEKREQERKEKASGDRKTSEAGQNKKVEVNYDLNPKNEFMHYDLDDMTGMDYFDLN